MHFTFIISLSHPYVVLTYNNSIIVLLLVSIVFICVIIYNLWRLVIVDCSPLTVTWAEGMGHRPMLFDVEAHLSCIVDSHKKLFTNLLHKVSHYF